jgi:hypothetical protein
MRQRDALFVDHKDGNALIEGFIVPVRRWLSDRKVRELHWSYS